MSDAWRSFLLTPDDVLFFRDGRPATRGDDHYLPSVFPPHPSTLYGALRTRRLLDEGVDLAQLGPDRQEAWARLPERLRSELGEWGGFGSLEIRGPWLVRHGKEVLVPAPADLGLTLARSEATSARAVLQAPRVDRVARFLAPKETTQGGHSHPMDLLQPFEHRDDRWVPWDPIHMPPRTPKGWYLTSDGLDRWVQGGVPEPADFLHTTELWDEEPRVGVALEDGRRSSLEGHLFTFGFVRLRPEVALGFEARGTKLRPECRIRLGGEGKTAWLSEGLSFPPALPRTAARLRLALVTPTLSEGGGRLPGFSEIETSGAVGGSAVRIRTAFLPGHVEIGGWDLARGAAKPLRRAIPAGAVFLAEGHGDAPPLRADHLHGVNHAGYPREHLARQGFGLVLAGADPDLTA